MTPDVNILVAASRQDHPHHAPALAWLEQAIASTFDKGFRKLLKPSMVTVLNGA